MITSLSPDPNPEQLLQGRAHSRRSFLKLSALSVLTLAPTPAIAGVLDWIASLAGDAERRLAFYNLHTGERSDTVYWSNGDYIDQGLSEINFALRDFRANEVKAIEPRLLDLLCAIHRKLDTTEPFHLISGYRSAATNAALHANSEGVARHSLHIEGKAADIRVPGRDLKTLHDTAVAMGGGGVGYYPASDFVHVDVGRVRYW